MTRRSRRARRTGGAACLAIAGLVLAAIPASASAVSGNDTLVLVAGTGVDGATGDGGPATLATLARPRAAVEDAAGNVLIGLRDPFSSVVRRIDPGGTISRIAGTYGAPGFTGDGGPASAATLNGVSGLVTDAAGNVYVADENNGRIRKIDPAGTISTLAADVGPLGLAIDPQGNLYVADYGHSKVLRITPAGVVTTIAGTGVAGFAGDGGPAVAAQLNLPAGVAVGPDGRVYIADSGNLRLRRIDRDGTIRTIAGGGLPVSTGDGGPATEAQVVPSGVAVDRAGNVYLSEIAPSNRVRRIGRNGVITTIAGNGTTGFSGNGGPARLAVLSTPFGISVTPNGDLLIADEGSRTVRRIVNIPPAAELTARPEAGAAPLTVSFDGRGSRGVNDGIVEHRWSFGDGGTGEGATVSHTYAAPGTYAVRLTVMDESGATAAATRQVSVAPAPPPGGDGPDLTLSAATMRGTWKVSRVRGTLTVRGQVPRGARLQAALLGPGRGSRMRTARTFRLAAAGAFTRRIALPADLVPGRYRVRVRELGKASPPLTTRVIAATLRAPREGVVARAYIATSLGGRPRTSAPFGSRTMVAYFPFAALPAPRLRVTVTWFHNGANVGSLPKPRARRVEALLDVEGQEHPRGRYRAELRVGRKLVAVAQIRIR